MQNETQNLINYLITYDLNKHPNRHLYDLLEEYADLHNMYTNDESSDLKLEATLNAGTPLTDLSEHDQLFKRLMDLHFRTWDNADNTINQIL